MFRTLREDPKNDGGDRRPVIINDLKILAQAQEEGISIILTEDSNALSRLAERLRQRDAISTHVLLLSEGFTPGRLDAPNQNELKLPPV